MRVVKITNLNYRGILLAEKFIPFSFEANVLLLCITVLCYSIILNIERGHIIELLKGHIKSYNVLHFGSIKLIRTLV